MKLLRQGLSDRRRQIRITREIEEGKDIRNLPAAQGDVELELEQRWGLERIFDRMNLSFCQGVLLIYAIIETPRVILLPFIIGRVPEFFLMGFIFGFVGDLLVPIALLLIHSVYRGLIDLRRNMNELLRTKKFAAPPVLVSEKELMPKDSLSGLDREYQNRYIKPVMFKTFQSGLSLAFNPSYQLGSGIIAGGLCFVIWLMRFVLNVIPPNIFTIWDLGVPRIDFVHRAYAFTLWGFSWFLIGILTWTLFVTWLVIIQASGNAVRIRPFESVKEYYEPATTLMLKTSFTVTLIVAWMSPFMLFWSVIP